MADIPINAVHRRIQYTSTGSAGPYSFAFAILDEGDLAVYDSTTLKTLTTHYTVSLGSAGTGSITFTSGNEPTSGNIVTITSDQAVARTSDFTTGGDFKAATSPIVAPAPWPSHTIQRRPTRPTSSFSSMLPVLP